MVCASPEFLPKALGTGLRRKTTERLNKKEEDGRCKGSSWPSWLRLYREVDDQANITDSVSGTSQLPRMTRKGPSLWSRDSIGRMTCAIRIGTAGTRRYVLIRTPFTSVRRLSESMQRRSNSILLTFWLRNVVKKKLERTARCFLQLPPPIFTLLDSASSSSRTLTHTFVFIHTRYCHSLYYPLVTPVTCPPRCVSSSSPSSQPSPSLSCFCRPPRPLLLCERKSLRDYYNA
jgi:hypothetical protein